MMSNFFAHFLTYLPTPVRFCPNIDFQFHYMVSDFGKSTYLPKYRTSFMDVPILLSPIIAVFFNVLEKPYRNFWRNIWKYFPESIDRTRALVYSFLENVFAYPNYNVILKIFIKITNESGCGIPIGYKNKNLVTCINWLLDVSLFPELYFVSSRLQK